MRRLARPSATLVGMLLATAAAFAPANALQPGSPGFRQIGRCSARFLEGVLPDGKGGLWMLDVEGGRILHADPGKDCVERAKLDGMPSGEKFAPDGTITIVGVGGIHSFDPTSGRIVAVAVSYEGKPITGLNDIAYDREGGFYFTAPGSSSPFRPDGRLFYRSAAGEVTLVAGGMAYPDGVAVSPDGNGVAVAEFGAKRIVSIPAVHAANALKTPVVLAYTQGGYGPDGMTYLPDGRLLVGNFGSGALDVLDPRYGIRTYYLPPDAGTFTTNVAVQDGSVVILEAQKGAIWQIPVAALEAGRP